jgi:peptidoglycan-N-acetylglucosamine deacetylase
MGGLGAGLSILAIGAGTAAWAVRGRSSTLMAPSVWRGHEFHARATFFQCGANAERLPSAARAVSQAGHEIGNHTYSHPRLWLRTPAFIDAEVTRAQIALTAIHGGAPPHLFRAPYGVRWPGLAAAQRRHSLLGVMWTVLARDWVAGVAADAVAASLERGASPGGILCLHDDRELAARPDIAATVSALSRALPVLADRGYRFETVSALLGL